MIVSSDCYFFGIHLSLLPVSFKLALGMDTSPGLWPELWFFPPLFQSNSWHIHSFIFLFSDAIILVTWQEGVCVTIFFSLFSTAGCWGLRCGLLCCFCEDGNDYLLQLTKRQPEVFILFKRFFFAPLLINCHSEAASLNHHPFDVMSWFEWLFKFHFPHPSNSQRHWKCQYRMLC